MKILIAAAILAATLNSPGWAGSAKVEGNAEATLKTQASLDSNVDKLVLAQSRTRADVVAALEASGYTVTEIRTTLLGRLRIVARNGEHRREVVMSRATGEILSDRIVEVFATASGKAGAKGSVDGEAGADVDAGISAGGGGVSVGVDGDSGVSVEVGDTGVSVGGDSGVSVDVGGSVDVEIGGNGGLSIDPGN